MGKLEEVGTVWIYLIFLCKRVESILMIFFCLLWHIGVQS